MSEPVDLVRPITSGDFGDGHVEGQRMVGPGQQDGGASSGGRQG